MGRFCAQSAIVSGGLPNGSRNKTACGTAGAFNANASGWKASREQQPSAQSAACVSASLAPS